MWKRGREGERGILNPGIVIRDLGWREMGWDEMG